MALLLRYVSTGMDDVGDAVGAVCVPVFSRCMGVIEVKHGLLPVLIILSDAELNGGMMRSCEWVLQNVNG